MTDANDDLPIVVRHQIIGLIESITQAIRSTYYKGFSDGEKLTLLKIKEATQERKAE